MSLPELSIRRPVATSMFYVAVAVLGIVSFVRLPIDLLPDIAFPTLSVWTTYRGAGPTEVERYVTDPIEEQLGRVPGVRRVTSTSREGQSLVRLQFGWGTDMEFAALHVREQLEDLRNSLPETADRPDILTSDPTSDPILTVAVTGEGLEPLAQLSETVLKRRLEQLDGVALAAVTGAPERELRVVVDPGRLQAHGLSLSDITSALDQANYSAPGGMIRRGRFQYSLRTVGQFTDVDQLREVTVGPEGGPGGGAAGRGSGAAGSGRPGSGGRGGSAGTPAAVRLDQVATVLDTVADAQTVSRFDGQPAIGLQVYKESGTNTVRVAGQVRATLDQLRSEYPGDPPDRGLEPGGVHPPGDLQRGAVAPPRRAARLPGPVPVPAGSPLPGGHRPLDPDLGAGRVRAVLFREREPQRHVAGRPGARGRDAGRQLDRRAGKRVPAPGGGGGRRPAGRPRAGPARWPAPSRPPR